MFPVFWGTAATERRLGTVADVCPACRQVRVVEVHRTGVTGHLYWIIKIGQGQFISAHGRCTTCRITFPIEITDYQRIQTAPVGELDALIAATNPRLDTRWDRAEKEFHRFAAIRAPLLRYGESLNQKAHSPTVFDRTSGLAFLATFSIPVLLGVAWSYMQEFAGVHYDITLPLMLLFFAGLIASFVVFLGNPSRVVKNRILPAIAAELAPLAPTRSEVDSVLSKLKIHGYRLCRFVSTSAIFNAMERAKRASR